MSPTNDQAAIGLPPAGREGQLTLSQASEVRNPDGKRRYGSERHLGQLAKHDRLPSIKVGRERFFLIDDLERVGVGVPRKVTPTFDELVAYARRIAVGGRDLTRAEVSQLSGLYCSLNEEAAA